MKEKKSPNIFKIASNVIMILLILGAFQMIFDNNYKNDHFGGIFLIAFILVNSLYTFVKNKKEGNKKFALFDVLLAIVSFFILVSYGLKMIIH